MRAKAKRAEHRTKSMEIWSANMALKTRVDAAAWLRCIAPEEAESLIVSAGSTIPAGPLSPRSMLAHADRIRIRRFVRDSLGCACADEVFEHIDVAGDRSGALLQLAIGGRLLIRVHRLNRAEALLRDLPRWLADGVRERDGLGLRRLRLVLAAPNPEAAEASARGIFERCAAAAGDVHLHVRSLVSVQAALGTQLLRPHGTELEGSVLP